MQSSTQTQDSGAIPPGFQDSPHGIVRDAVVQTLLRASIPDRLDHSKRLYIPRGALFNHFSPNHVRQLLFVFLSELRGSDLEELLNIICSSSQHCRVCGQAHCTRGRIIFATLIWIARQDLIPLLLETEGERFCDSHLPIADSDKNTAASQRTWIGVLRTKMSAVECQLFNQVRLQLASPFLAHDAMQTLALHDNVTLPFTSIRTIPGQGAERGRQCQVDEVTIHNDHHALVSQASSIYRISFFLLQRLHYCDSPSACYRMISHLFADNDVGAQQEFSHHDNTFALKSFSPGHGAKTFEIELGNNQATPRHDRITPLLAAFKHNQKSYLVFPWAHGGDLETFWKGHTLDNNHSVQWVLRECFGIADGLAALHFPNTVATEEVSSRSSPPLLHTDIKPKNILCFQVQGQGTFLRLADFGFSKPGTVNADPQFESSTVHDVKTYRSPEQDLEEFMSLKSDVWSLGCVFLEFMTWCLLGWEHIKPRPFLEHIKTSSEHIKTFSDKRLEELDDRRATRARGGSRNDRFFRKVVKKHLWLGRSGLRFRSARDVTCKAPRKKAPESESPPAGVIGRTSSLYLLSNVQAACRVKDSVTKVSENMGLTHSASSPSVDSEMDLLADMRTL